MADGLNCWPWRVAETTRSRGLEGEPRVLMPVCFRSEVRSRTPVLFQPKWLPQRACALSRLLAGTPGDAMFHLVAVEGMPHRQTTSAASKGCPTDDGVQHNTGKGSGRDGEEVLLRNFRCEKLESQIAN